MTRITPFYGEYDLHKRGIVFVYMISWFLDQFDHNRYTRMCDYGALDTSSLLVVSVLIVHGLMLHDTAYTPLSYPPLGNIYRSSISSKKVLSYKHNPTLHYGFPGGA